MHIAPPVDTSQHATVKRLNATALELTALLALAWSSGYEHGVAEERAKTPPPPPAEPAPVVEDTDSVKPLIDGFDSISEDLAAAAQATDPAPFTRFAEKLTAMAEDMGIPIPGVTADAPAATADSAPVDLPPSAAPSDALPPVVDAPTASTDPAPAAVDPIVPAPDEQAF